MFRLAKQLLQRGPHDNNGRVRYICWAIDDAVFRRSEAYEMAAVEAKGIIHERLGGDYQSFEDWLKFKHGINPWIDRKKLQATRHAWLDSLIAEFKAAGN